MSQPGTVRVPLTQGLYALVDEADASAVMTQKWRLHKSPRLGGRPPRLYAATRRHNGPMILMHRFILGLTSGDPDVDHRDGDGLNNTRGNLRPAAKSQNGMNRPPPVTNTSGFKGVVWNRQRQRWQAQINARRRHYYLGLFDTPQAAATAYDEAARRLHGKFARLNFPEADGDTL